MEDWLAIMWMWVRSGMLDIEPEDEGLVKGFTDEVTVSLACGLELLEQFLVHRAGELVIAMPFHVFLVV